METFANAELRIWPHHIFCSSCGSLMIKRVPKPSDDWESFYGCREFPECKETRGIFPDGRIMPEVYYLDDLRWIYEGELDG